jgi:large conductance mechanosensitive channel
MTMLDEFKKFLLRGNLVELAVAIVIGVAFGDLVTAFVEDMVTPLIAAIGGQPDSSSLDFTTAAPSATGTSSTS